MWVSLLVFLATVIFSSGAYAQQKIFTDEELQVRCATFVQEIERLGEQSKILHADNAPATAWRENDDKLAMTIKRLRKCRLTGE